MQLHRISKGEMPPEGKYVLIYVPNSPWRDSTDPKGVFWKVAKKVTQRYHTGFMEAPPYRFEAFGPDSYNAQEVDIWCELPAVNLGVPEIEVNKEIYSQGSDEIWEIFVKWLETNMFGG